MKKILLSAVAVCVVVAGGGYYYAVERFAKESEYFEANLESSSVFKAKSIQVDKYKFQITLDDLSVTFPSADPTAKNINVIFEAPTLLQYKPYLNTFVMSTPSKESTVHVDADAIVLDLQVTGDSGATVFSLSKSPNLKNLSLMEFLSDYVQSASLAGGKFSVSLKGSNSAVMSVDSTNTALSREKSGLGERVILDYDTKGAYVNSEEVARIILKFMPNLPNSDNLLRFYSPVSGFEGIKRDTKGRVSFDGDIKKIIEVFKEASTTGNQVDLLQVLPGTSTSIVAHDEMLGSSMDADLVLTVPKPESTDQAVLGYKVQGTVSPEFQEVLPKLIAQKLQVFKQELKETTVADLMPDFASLGKMVFDLNAKGTLETKIGTVSLDVHTADYGVLAHVDAKEANMVVKVTIKNYEDLLSALEAYAEKVVNHPDMADLVNPEWKTQLPVYVATAKASLKGMGKEETIDGKPAIVIEQTIPTAILGAVAAIAPEPAH